MIDYKNMEDYVSDSDSDYTSYWRDWVSCEGRAGQGRVAAGRVD